jgi:glycosyltransferase involved in cell wall biosynthesis
LVITSMELTEPNRNNMNHDSMPIHVLHLIQHLEVGGAERLVAELVPSLDSRKIRSLVCVYQSVGAFGEELRKAGYPVVFLRKYLVTPHLPKALRPLFLPFESLCFVLRLGHLMRKHRIHLVHSHLFSANLWGRLGALLAGCPATVITEHTTREWEISLKKKLFNFLLRPFTDRVVSVSEAVARTVRPYHQLAPEKMVIIPNGMRWVDSPAAKGTPSASGLPGRRPRIGSVAFLSLVKRHDLLLKALRICHERIPALTCCIAGDGPERKRLEALSESLGLSGSVFFLGERHDVSHLLPHFDLLVSASDHEGLPMNLLESMAAGIPVVATDVGGTREVVKHRITGFLVEAGDANSLAEGICTVLENPSLAKKMVENARQLVRTRYSMADVAKRWESLYENVISERRRR